MTERRRSDLVHGAPSGGELELIFQLAVTLPGVPVYILEVPTVCNRAAVVQCGAKTKPSATCV